MSRIPYPDLEELSESVRQRVMETPANVSRMLAAASEPVFKVVSEMGVAFINGSPLPAKLREIAILRVGYLSNSAYEVFQHEALARHVGFSDEQIHAIKVGGSAITALSEVEANVLAYVDDLVDNVRASDENLAAVRQYLSDTQVVDLTLVTGMYMMICRFLETTGIENDAEAIDWKHLTES